MQPPPKKRLSREDYEYLKSQNIPDLDTELERNGYAVDRAMSATDLMHTNTEAESPTFKPVKGDLPAAARLMASGASYGAYGGLVDREGMAKAREQMGPIAPVFELMGGALTVSPVQQLGKRALAKLATGPAWAQKAAPLIRGLTGNVATKGIAADARLSAKVATGAGNVLRQAGGGATQGAVYGFNTGEPGERIQQAATGAATGALLTGAVAAAPELLSAVRGVKEWARQRWGSFGSAEAADRAVDELAQQALNQNWTPQQFAARARELVGKESRKIPGRPDAMNADMFGDLGTGRIMSALGNVDENATAQAGSALQQKMVDRGQNTPSVREGFGELAGVDPGAPAIAARKEMRADSRVATRKAYDEYFEKYSDPIESPELRRILSVKDPAAPNKRHPLVESAIAGANAEMRKGAAAGEIPPSHVFRPPTIKDPFGKPMVDPEYEIAVRMGTVDPQTGQPLFGEAAGKWEPIRNARWWDSFSGQLKGQGYNTGGGAFVALPGDEAAFARQLHAETTGAFQGSAELSPLVNEVRKEAQTGHVADRALKLAQKSARSSDPRAESFLIEEELSRLPPERAEAIRPDIHKAVASDLLRLSDSQIADRIGTPAGWEQITQSLPDEKAVAEFRRQLQLRAWRIQQANLYGNKGRGGQAPMSFDALGALTPWDLASILRGSPALGIAHVTATLQGKASKGNVAMVDEKMLKFAGDKATPSSAADVVRRMRAIRRPSPIPTRAATDRATRLAGIALRSTRGEQQ